MLDRSDHFEEISHAFSCHELQLDITLNASDICSTMAFCAAEFSKIPISPDRLSLQKGGSLWLRFDCVSSDQITQIRACFLAATAPQLLRLTTTIGRAISRAPTTNSNNQNRCQNSLPASRS